MPVEDAVSVTVEETVALFVGETQEREGGTATTALSAITAADHPDVVAYVSVGSQLPVLVEM